MRIWKFTLPMWYTFPKSSTGVWVFEIEYPIADKQSLVQVFWTAVSDQYLKYNIQ